MLSLEDGDRQREVSRRATQHDLSESPVTKNKARHMHHKRACLCGGRARQTPHRLRTCKRNRTSHPHGFTHSLTHTIPAVVSIDANGQQQGSPRSIQGDPMLESRATNFVYCHAFWSGCPGKSGSSNLHGMCPWMPNLETVTNFQEKGWPQESARHMFLEAKIADNTLEGVSEKRWLQESARHVSLDTKFGDSYAFWERVRQGDRRPSVRPFGEQSSQESDTQAGRPERKPPGQQEIQPTRRQSSRSKRQRDKEPTGYFAVTSACLIFDEHQVQGSS